MSRESTPGQRETLLEGLDSLNTAWGFLLVTIAAILLSFQSIVRQRQGLCIVLQGREEEGAQVGDVYHLQRRAGAMVVGVSGFFLSLAARGAAAADRSDPLAVRVGGMNLWASILVFSASILRLEALDMAAGNVPAEAEAELQDG